MFRFTAVFFTFLVLLPIQIDARDKTLKVALFDYYPFLMKDSPDKGYAFDITREAVATEGYSLTFRFLPLIRSIHDTIHLKHDIILGLNPSHTAEIAFSKTPITTLRFMIWSRKGLKWRYDSTSSLKEVKMVTISGFDYTSSDKAYQDYINSKPDNVRVMFGDNAIQRAFKLINANRADIFSLDIDQATVILKKMNMADKFMSVGELKDHYRGYFGVSQNHPQKEAILIAYEKGMKKIRKNGKLQSIIDYYKAKYGLKHQPL